MKQIFTSVALAIAALTSVTANAQNAREASVKFDKTNESAVVADFDKPVDVVEAALKQRLDKEGLGKMKSSKGFMTYAGTLWPSVSSDKIDVYFKVDGKKDKSTVSVLISKGYNNFVTSGTDQTTINNVKTFLNGLIGYTNSYQLGLNIKAQEEALKKAEKAYNNATDDNKDLLSQKEKLEKKLAENNNDQVLKQKALDEEKKKLNDLKAQMN
jgi:hypothetical protein